MNILFVDQFSDEGGAQLAMLDVLEGVRRRGWSARIMAPGAGQLLKRTEDAGIPVSSLPLRPLTNGQKSSRDTLRYVSDLPAMHREISRAISRHKIDLLYINGPRILPAVVGFDTPVLFHAHNFVTGRGPRALATQAVKLTRATIIAASRFAAEPFRQATRRAIEVVYNGAPDFGFGSKSANPQPVRIGIVGRIAPEKGQADFIRAASLLNECGASFSIHGDSLFSAPEYDREVRALASGTSVRFEPWRDDAGSIYSSLDILAVPSRAPEACPRVIPEAFSAGIAVVAYPAGGIPELIDHGRTGYLTSSASPKGLADSLRLLIADPPLRRRLARAGRVEWEQRFTKERFQKSVCDVIEAACSE